MTGSGRRAYAISLVLAEAQLVFEALAELPFKQVYELIGRLNRQANELAVQGGDVAARQVYRLDAAEFALVLRALGELPFSRVHDLLASLNEQARAQADTSLGDADAVANG
jgi:hypothetical protein